MTYRARLTRAAVLAAVAIPVVVACLYAWVPSEDGREAPHGPE